MIRIRVVVGTLSIGGLELEGLVLWLFFAAGMQPPLPVKTQMFHIGDNWTGDVQALSVKLAAIDGVKEAVVLIDERVALLKVLQTGWNEAAARQLIEETR